MADDEIPTSGADVPLESPSVAESPQAPDTGGDKPLSLREELVKNLNEFKEPKELRPTGKDKSGSGPDVGVSADGKLGPDGKKRDPETGQFIPKDKAAAPEKAAALETAPKQDAQAPAVSSPPSLPPGWSPETKAFVSGLPPDHPLRKDVEKREKEVSDGFKKYSDDAKKYSEIEQVLAPVRQTYQQAGVQSDAEAVRRLLMWESSFRNPQTRMQAFHGLARQFGVDLASLAQSPGSNQTPTDVPQQQFHPQQIQQLVSEQIAPIQGYMAQQEIAAFAANSKEAPYFDQVKVKMGQLIASGAAQDLPSAYKLAVAQDQAIQDDILEKRVAEKLASHQKEQQEQVKRSQDAKKAAISPSQRAPSGPALNSGKKPDGVRGSILQAIESIREERA